VKLTDRQAIARQDRASLRGLLGQRALVEFASADDMQSWRYRLPRAATSGLGSGP
jgi:hypothetical protein